MANSPMLGSLLVPEMQRRSYNWRMSMGPILDTGGLAMIIPPSALAVLLASGANIDVGGLLIAGFQTPLRQGRRLVADGVGEAGPFRCRHSRAPLIAGSRVWCEPFSELSYSYQFPPVWEATMQP